MFALNGCICAAEKTCRLLLEGNSVKLRSLIPLRTATYKYEENPKETPPKAEIRALTGYNDPHFTENFKLVIRSPKLFVQGLTNFGKEVKRFIKEEKQRINEGTNARVDNVPSLINLKSKIDVIFKYENPEDLDGYSVETDSSFNVGFSSASLKITREETGLFSGYICEDIPKDGNVSATGFATMMFPKQHLAFFRIRRYDWTQYSHLVLKIRGDGRTHLVLLHVPDFVKDTKYYMYAQPLYTRGGPYWQIVKMPLSHFFFMVKGSISDRGQNVKPYLSRVSRMAITASGFEGPFKLEIDYVGLMFNMLHKNTSPYEEYKV